jgi:hypothetical protein
LTVNFVAKAFAKSVQGEESKLCRIKMTSSEFVANAVMMSLTIRKENGIRKKK